jgi:hypothetical protein
VTKNCRKYTAEKILNVFFDQKLQFTYPYASIEDVQATEEAFRASKENIQHFKIGIS